VLSNAIKFTPRGGVIAVASGFDDESWWFSVADTGPSIPAEEQVRIFEAFYRAPPDRHYPQGLGLGLTIARDIVAAHDGTLTAESAPGAGATFTVRLPMVKT
jgi:signal transduction histidine kinase